MKHWSTAVLMVAFVSMSPLSAYAARLSIDPATSTQGLSDTFVATIRVDNEGECLNAIHVGLQYPVDTLRAVDFSRGESIMSLWVEEPKIDTEKGVITFSGGIPGGYCGRIQGDPSQTNVVGKVVFTVIDSSAPRATVAFLSDTRVYLHDGVGTAAELKTEPAAYEIVASPQAEGNPWLKEIAADHISPDAFAVEVHSDSRVFGGRYYIVFSTVDKQSGIDHFEIFERGTWKTITSPYQLRDQSLLGVAGGIQVRAIDKAGNIRLGDYAEDSVPERQFTLADALPVMTIIALILVLGGFRHLAERKRQYPADTV